MRLAAAITVTVALALTACSNEDSVGKAATDPESTVSGPPALDPTTGLKMAENWELVRGNCTACHSAKLITQQRGSAQQWLTMIRWMQKKQNLWQFDTDTEGKIIAYLAKNYPPRADQRRVALPVDLMPPNPYAAEATRAHTDNK